ncbi:arsenate reductase (glutaredoxin) [Nitrobacter winogradskyi]|uniref:Arsenate reductase n=2 Tax=Nitrobacter winogradskyi TaxID=913 RepID=A0ACC6AES0_NITWI|nr:arsenate reductase (glutaredoxin) [Nitrobacter winogradskyi]MCP1998007.1 arsenate reductase [Nitrobacter winogradskyi]GEC16063.1 arsenate reductase [Nitrobacter winogradskyi]
MTVTIYHNPSCSKSRDTLAIIRQSGEEPVIIEYLKRPPDRARLRALADAIGLSIRGLLRENGSPYAELDLGNPKWTDDQLLDFIVAHPILLQRPIVETPKGARICRPPERVLDLLTSPAVGEYGENTQR